MTCVFYEFYVFYAFYAWWIYFQQSGALAEGTSQLLQVQNFGQQQHMGAESKVPTGVSRLSVLCVLCILCVVDLFSTIGGPC